MKIKNTEGKEIIIPINPLVFSSCIEFYKAESSSSIVYAQISNNSKFNPKSFRPLQKGELETMLKSFSVNAEFKDFSHMDTIIPDSLLKMDFINFDNFTWLSPSKKRKFFFELNGFSTAVEIILPAILFVVKGKTLKQTFVNKDYRLKKKYYQTVMMNTSSDGNVCLGDQVIKSLHKFQNIQQFLDYWEAVYFNSPFTHMSINNEWPFNDNLPFKSVGKNIINVWKLIVKEGELKEEWLKQRKSKQNDKS